MKTLVRFLGALLLLAVCVWAIPAAAQVSIGALGVPATQDFNTLPVMDDIWMNNSTIPGWYTARTGTGTFIIASNGSSSTPALYSFGTNGAPDRALGSIGGGDPTAGAFWWGVRLKNNTGSTIASLNVVYTGEQWRSSGASGQTVTFSYLVGSPSVVGDLAEFQMPGVGVTALDFPSPSSGTTAGARDGNNPIFRSMKTFTIANLNIPDGTEIMLRWSDPDHTGLDHGLAVDDFSVTANGVAPECAPDVGNPTVTGPTDATVDQTTCE